MSKTQVINEHLRMFRTQYLVDTTSPTSKYADLDLYYVRGPKGIPHIMEWLGTADAPRIRAIGVDTETSGLYPRKDKLATLQIGTPLGSDPRAYVIDVRTVSKAELQPVLDVLTARNVVKLAQNGKFECGFLQVHLDCPIRNMADTQVAELTLRAGLLNRKDDAPKAKTRSGLPADDRAVYKHTSMAAMCKRYLGIEIDKDHDLRTGFYATPAGMHNERQIIYAAGDVVYPFYIAEKQKVEAANRSLANTLKIEFEFVPILTDMELTGMRINEDAWQDLYVEAYTKLQEVELGLDELIRPSTEQKDMFHSTATPTRPIYPKTNKPINWDSNIQVKWALVAYCKRVGWKHEIVTEYPRLWALKRQYGQAWLTKKLERNIWLRDTGRGDECREWSEKDIPDSVIPESQYCLLLDTDKDTLKLRMIRQQLPKDFVQPLLEQGGFAIRCSTFGIEFLRKHVDPTTGRIHTVWHQGATATGRTSSSPNLQNIPKDQRYRKCFIPGDGKKFIIFDYSQIEPRLSAQVSKDPVYTAAFLAFEDLYINVAEAMFGERPDKHTVEGARMRAIAKVIVLGLAYRMGPWKLRDTLTLALGKDIMLGTVELPTIEYVTQLYNKFFEQCSGIRAFQDECSTIADPVKSTRPRIWDEFLEDTVTWIEAPCGRKRFFPPDAKGVFTEAPNAPIQGCSATITKAAAVLIQRAIDDNGWGKKAHMVNVVHDELVIEADDDIADALAKLAKPLMEKAARFYIPDIPVIAEPPEGSPNGVVDWWAKEVPEEEVHAA